MAAALKMTVFDEEGVVVAEGRGKRDPPLHEGEDGSAVGFVIGRYVAGPGFARIGPMIDAFRQVFAAGDVDRALAMSNEVDRVGLWAKDSANRRFHLSNLHFQQGALLFFATHLGHRGYDPGSLGAVDAVDVVALAGLAGVQLASVYDAVRSKAVGRDLRLTGEDAERIAALWRALPAGEEARCHTPPYGLRFWREGRLLAEASLCWECDNARGYAGDETIAFAFNAKSPTAQSLLLQLRHVLPTKG